MTGNLSKCKTALCDVLIDNVMLLYTTHYPGVNISLVNHSAATYGTQLKITLRPT